jgi:hypothetical protein
MTFCESTDFMYPMLADIYYPITEAGGYGNVKKQWILDRTIACAFNPAGRKFKQDIQTNANITIDNSLVGRTRTDITQSSRDNLNAVTNIIIANIRDTDGNIIYNESSGIRAGRSTIFEIATLNPIVGPFGKTEYYKVVIARSDNQAADI